MFYRNVPSLRYGSIVIDAMILDYVDGFEGEVIERLMSYYFEGEISLLLPHSVKAELESGNTPERVRRRARDLIFSNPVTLNADEQKRADLIYELLNGNAQPGKHLSDSLHVFEASKYGRFFVTNDQRIIRKRGPLLEILGKTLFVLDIPELHESLLRLEHD